MPRGVARLKVILTFRAALKTTGNRAINGRKPGSVEASKAHYHFGRETAYEAEHGTHHRGKTLHTNHALVPKNQGFEICIFQILSMINHRSLVINHQL